MNLERTEILLWMFDISGIKGLEDIELILEMRQFTNKVGTAIHYRGGQDRVDE